MSGSNSSSAAATTRDPSQTPFASDSVFNLPLGSDAQWQSNGQLSGAGVYINTVGNYNENIYSGSASDPLVTVTNNASSGGTPGTFQVHIPADAVPAGGNDASLSIDDTSTGTWYSFSGFQWTGSNSATVTQGSGESDSDSGLTVDNSNWDQGVGTLRESDLQAGVIDHMLRVQLPTNMLESYTDSFSQLAPYAWPQTQEDGFAVNGNGGPVYSGTIPFGVTIGIPAGAVEPAAVAANAGANMLWQAMQDHGAMIRDSTGSSNANTLTFQADQNVDPNDPLIQGMEQYGSQIMASAEILTNQGPNSVNGGGTPIVPLDPSLSDSSSATTGTSASASTADSSATNSSSPAGATATVPTSDIATITPDSLSGGQTGSAATAASGTGTATIPSGTSATDVTPPLTSSSSGSSSTQTSAATRHHAWWTSHHGAAFIAAHHG